MTPGTSDVRSYGFLHPSGRRVFLLDTPGFDDTNRSDTDVLKTISGDLANMYRKNVKLSGIIYLHRITDVRFSGSTAKNLSVFKKLCGDNFYPNIILATTMWENLGDSGLSSTVGDRREKELAETKNWWGLMIERGSRTFRHSDDKGSALKSIDYLISLRRRAVLDIQTQLVDQHKSLQDTSAGIEVERELQQTKEKYAKELKELEEEKKQALVEKDKEQFEMLRKEAEKSQEIISRMERGQQDLQISCRQLLTDSEERNKQVIQELQQQLQQGFKAHENMERRLYQAEVRQRERDERFAQERKLAEDAQRQHNENAEKQHNEALEKSRRQDENTRRLMMALDRERKQHEYTQRQNEIQQQRHETQIQRRDDDTAQQSQRLESLQEQVSNLTHTLSNPPSSPSAFSTIPNDDDVPSSPDHSDTPDYDEDWKLEAIRRQRASRERSLAFGAPLLIAVSGPADVSITARRAQ
ncbi:MAG: hypothetical protein Q9199_003811 [Rusavskia elegans]